LTVKHQWKRVSQGTYYTVSQKNGCCWTLRRTLWNLNSVFSINNNDNEHFH